MLDEPDVVAPVEPLVPVLLEVPADPLVDGDVEVELPVEPMPEVAPELDDGIDDDVPDDGERLVELPAEPMLEPVDAPVEPVVDEPLMLPELEGRDCVAVDDEDGLVDPVAEPPAEPMPEAEPLAVPVELQAARAAAQAAARISFCIRISLSNTGAAGAAPGCIKSAPGRRRAGGAGVLHRGETRPSRTVRRKLTPQRASSLARSFFNTPSGPKSSTSSACPGRTGWLR